MSAFFFFLPLLFALSFLGGGSFTSFLTSKGVLPQRGSTLTASSAENVDQSTFPSYRTFFQRETLPEWRTVSFDHFSLSVPYSSSWRFSDMGLSVYDVDGVSESVPTIRFGRPSDAGTYASREYFVYRKSRQGTFEDNSLARLKIDLEFACIDGFGSERINIGRVEGILHHMGGAKGCSTGFAFNRGRYTYYVYRTPDIQQDAPEIDEEMERVIESIHE